MDQEKHGNKMQPWSFLRCQIEKNKEAKGIFGDKCEEIVTRHILDNTLSMPNA